MAMGSYSLNRPPTTLSLPLSQSAPSKPYIQIPQTQQTPSSSSILLHGTSHVLLEESLVTLAEVAEAAVLTNAAAEADRENIQHLRQERLWDVVLNGDTLMARRRRRRRKRRDIGWSTDDEAEAVSRYLLEGCSSRSERSANLTSIQEAEFALYLKEESMLDATASNQIGVTSSSNTKDALDIRRRKRLSTERALLKARECRERIVLSYKRLVVSIALPYQGKGLSLQDLIQEGSIGLLRGAQRYDNKRGYKLSTYVYWWIKQAIIKALDDKSRIVRLPGSLSSKTTKISEATSFLARRFGRSPTYKEIADFLNIAVPNVQIAIEKSTYPISIDQPLNNEAVKLRDIIPGPDETKPEVMFSKLLRSEILEKLLKKLSEREETIIRLHYGLNGGTARSCDEIGKLMNLSRERIRQIHCIALSKLQEDKTFFEDFRHGVI